MMTHDDSDLLYCKGPCTDGTIRLGDNGIWRGRVEVCLRNNTWFTICDNHWSQYEASVICSQLGYSRYGELLFSSE